VGEALDAVSLSLPDNQDALIASVAKANPKTVVVLETSGPVLMPWVDQAAGIVQAWYPGTAGGEAIARVLFGEVNPSGHLPATFPASEASCRVLNWMAIQRTKRCASPSTIMKARRSATSGST
jgi:beta-glucosidase